MGIHTLRWVPGTNSEAIAFGEWFEEQRTGYGKVFANELITFVDRIVVHPRMYERISPGRRGHEVRRGMLERFPILVTYVINSTEGVILLISHAQSPKQPRRKRLA